MSKPERPVRPKAASSSGQGQNISRKEFLYKSGFASLSMLVGANVVFASNLPKGVLPLFMADEELMPGKHSGLLVLNDRPINAETPAHLLDESVTSAERMFVRNNGIPPTAIDSAKWELRIDGESALNPMTFKLEDLKRKFKTYTYQLTLECGGNGRSEFNPPAKGNQWTTGAVSCGEWTGVRLRDVLSEVGIKDDAVYIGYYGTDTHLSGDTKKNPISRGVPMSKALEDESLIAFALNGKDIPVLNGHPLRLVFGGWPASASGKWLNRISIRNKVHDGTKMGGKAYRVPCKPVAPGELVPDEEMCIIESMPVKSIITYPKTGGILRGKKSLTVRGHAWAGDRSVRELLVSIDFGATWQKAKLKQAANRLAWQDWSAELSFPQKGYYEAWARAIDEDGKSQPILVPGWNPKGYLNNACHRIAIKVV